MPITSISMSKELFDDLNRVQKELGYSGRSETIRAAIRMLVNEARIQESQSGLIHGVLIVIHDHESETMVSEIKHSYPDVIYTQLHNRFKEGKCLELFIIEGDSERVRRLINELRLVDQNEYVKFYVV
jgi:CopG family nickel-responsive transcriptional regulator